VDGDGVAVVNNLRFPGQYLDGETGANYNLYRNYQPILGRYIEPDPILQPNFIIAEEVSFIVPFFAKTPDRLHPYNYALLDPINMTDPPGLGILSFIRCLYYGWIVSQFGEECQHECPTDFEGTAKFIEKYTTSGSLSAALLNCTCNKAGPKLCAKWLANCFTAPYGLPGQRPE
jgi:RHS repeat-associated protein